MRDPRVCSLALSLSFVWSASLVAIAQDAADGEFPQPPRKRKAPAPETVFIDGRNVLRNGGSEMGTEMGEKLPALCGWDSRADHGALSWTGVGTVMVRSRWNRSPSATSRPVSSMIAGKRTSKIC